MAIIVEEGKKGIGFLNILTWLVVIGIIIFATYYIFFKQADVVDVIIPSKDAFDNIDQLSKIALDPSILDNPTLKSLTETISGSLVGHGRLDPFAPL